MTPPPPSSTSQVAADSVRDVPTSKTPEQVGSHVRSAMIWNMASMVITQLAQFAIFLLIANQLNPTVFGIFALAAVFIDFLYIQGSTAFIDATVQRQDFSRRALNTHFWAGLGVVLFATLFFMAMSGPIGGWMNTPDLAPILFGMSLTLLPLPFTIAPYAIMKQKMDFKGLAVRNIFASITGALIALAVAFSPLSGWALVVQRAVQLTVAAVIVVMHTRWLPTLAFDKREAKSYLSASGRIFTAQGVCGAVPRMIDLIIGVFFSPAVLGAMRVAIKFVEVIIAALVNPIAQMWVVLVAKAGKDPVERRNIFMQLSKLTALISIPGFAGIALVAQDFNKLALKSDYALVGPMLAIVSACYLFIPLTYFRNSVLTSLNRLNMLVMYAVIDLIVVVAAMLLAAQTNDWRLVLIASATPNITSMIFSLPLVCREMNVKKREFFWSVTPAYIAGGVMVLGVLGAAMLAPEAAPLVNLIGKSLIGAIIYVGVLFVFFRTWTMESIRSLKSR